MKKKKKKIHRPCNGVDCREYGESYVRYYIEPKSFVIHYDNLYFETKDIDIQKCKLVKNECVLSSFLNLGKQIYGKVLLDKIKKNNYMYDKYIKFNSGYKI